MSEEKTLQDGEELKKAEVEETEEETTEEDETSEEETEGETTDEEEDEYTPLTQEEHKKLLSERDNYKKGMLKAKAGLKKDKPADTSDFVTKADLQKDKESRAIKEVLADSPEMDTDWTKFVSFIPKVTSSDDLASIKKKIKAGYVGYKSTLDTENADDEDKDAKAELSKTKGKGGSTPPAPKKNTKKILNTDKGGMSSWY